MMVLRRRKTEQETEIWTEDSGKDNTEISKHEQT